MTHMKKAFTDINKVSVFLAPRKTILGKDAVAQLGKEAKALGAKKVLIVTDPGVMKAGLCQIVQEVLNKASISAEVFDKVEPEPPVRVVEACIAAVKGDHYDLIVGLGGGSALDVAKGAATIAGHGGKVVDYVGMDAIPGPGLPKILIPTTAGTGSEATRVFVMTDEADNTKKVVFSDFLMSDVAILDPMLTLSMPAAVTADTGFDALVHAIESYVSVNTTPFAEILALESMSLIAHNLPMACAKGSHLMARYNMLLAANLAGSAFTSGGLGAVHGLAYVLGTQYHMPHGRSNAIMLPHIMAFNRTGNLKKFAEIAGAMGEVTEGLSLHEASEKSVEAVKKLLTTVGISFHLSDYGIPREDLPILVEGGLKQSRLFVPNPRDLTESDVRKIYEGAY
jgi:alcohol dehydrogenase class IV